MFKGKRKFLLLGLAALLFYLLSRGQSSAKSIGGTTPGNSLSPDPTKGGALNTLIDAVGNVLTRVNKQIDDPFGNVGPLDRWRIQTPQERVGAIYSSGMLPTGEKFFRGMSGAAGFAAHVASIDPRILEARQWGIKDSKTLVALTTGEKTLAEVTAGRTRNPGPVIVPINKPASIASVPSIKSVPRIGRN